MPMNHLKRFLNLRDAKKALRDPGRALRTLRSAWNDEDREPLGDEERREGLAQVLGLDPGEIRGYEEELERAPLRRWLQRGTAEFEDRPYSGGGIGENGLVLYPAVRALDPGNVLEIGVANGFSTALILGGLAKNPDAPRQVHGIDRPRFEEEVRAMRGKRGLVGGLVPPGRETGWVAPRHLRASFCYQLHVGDFTGILSDVVSEFKGLDFVSYDASKDPADLKQAFDEIISSLNEGGLLVIDDVKVEGPFEDALDRYRGRGRRLGDCGIYVHDS
jgi:predicted O-methyltransferase YrrM